MSAPEMGSGSNLFTSWWIAGRGLTDVLKEANAKAERTLSEEMDQPILSGLAPESKYSVLRKNKPVSSPCN